MSVSVRPGLDSYERQRPVVTRVDVRSRLFVENHGKTFSVVLSGLSPNPIPVSATVSSAAPFGQHRSFYFSHIRTRRSLCSISRTTDSNAALHMQNDRPRKLNRRTRSRRFRSEWAFLAVQIVRLSYVAVVRHRHMFSLRVHKINIDFAHRRLGRTPPVIVPQHLTARRHRDKVRRENFKL